MVHDIESNLYIAFAVLLEYPTPSIKQQVDELISQLNNTYPQASTRLIIFQQYVDKVTLAQLEESYTQTFDLNGTCYPYVGHHLFGESYKRSWFMSYLNREYRRTGFSTGSELPDHIGLILRYLALSSHDEFSQSLVLDGLIPAMEKMAAAFDGHSENPYRQVIQSLSMVICEGYGTSIRPVVCEQRGGEHG